MDFLDIVSLLDFVLECIKHWRIAICICGGGLLSLCFATAVSTEWLQITIVVIALIGTGLFGWHWDHKKR